MSKKRREHQEKSEPVVWTRMHYAIGAGVVVVSAAIAIALFTIFVGSGFGEGKPSIDDVLPAQGADLPAEKSAAADALGKPWDQMSDDEHTLVETEVKRAFNTVTFRAQSGLVPGLDVVIENGQTQFSHGYQQLAKPVGNVKIADSLVFYCPEAGGGDHAWKYFTSPDGTTLSDQSQAQGDQPWESIIAGIDWTQPVDDLGFGDVEGRKVHGLRVVFGAEDPGKPRNRVDYWFDVENARLLAREPYIEGGNTAGSRYVLRYRAVPPPRVDATQQQPDCVPALLAKYGG